MGSKHWNSSALPGATLLTCSQLCICMEDLDAAKLDYLQYLYDGPCLAIKHACYTQVFKAEACWTSWWCGLGLALVRLLAFSLACYVLLELLVLSCLGSTEANAEARSTLSIHSRLDNKLTVLVNRQLTICSHFKMKKGDTFFKCIFCLNRSLMSSKVY